FTARCYLHFLFSFLYTLSSRKIYDCFSLPLALANVSPTCRTVYLDTYFKTGFPVAHFISIRKALAISYFTHTAFLVEKDDS
ncbi:hypothetical protein, partial [Priestia filamentosa]|uniref:hypothetical protein n=1 Tax=Priestia filamentosa TaxID=1402861 RepID=UPI003982B683